MEFLVFLSLMGFVMLLHIVLKNHIELILFASIAATIGVLNIFTFAGYLQMTAYGIFYSGLCCAVIGLFLYITKYRQLAKDLFSPGIVVFVVVSVLYRAKFIDFTYGGYDEIRSWGLAVKEMLLTHQFPGVDSAISHKDYFRGTTLFQYFMVLNTSYHEGRVYFAHFILQFAPLMVMFHKVSWKQFHWILIFLATVFYFIQGMGTGVVSLYVDHVLSVYFAMIIYVYFILKIERKYIFLLIPILFALPLIKKAGFSLSLLALFLISADLILQIILKTAKDNHLSDWFSIPEIKKKEMVMTFVVIIMLWSAPLSAYYSWRYRLNTVGIGEPLSMSLISPKKIIHDISNASEYKRTVTKAFFKAVQEQPFISSSDKGKIYSKIEQNLGFQLPQAIRWTGTGQITLIQWLVLITGVYLCAFILQFSQKSKWIIAIIYACMLAGLILFSFALLLFYVYVISPPQALQLISFNRHIGIFVTAFCLIGFGFLFQIQKNDDCHFNKKNEKSKLAANLLGLFIICGLYVIEPPASRGILSRHGYTDIRASLQKKIQFVKSNVSLDTKMFVVYQNSPGGHISMIHDLFPIKTTKSCNSLGQLYSTHDHWTCDISPAEWGKLIQEEKADYVFLGQVDDQFWDRYDVLFEEGTQISDFLFKIHKISANHIRLSPIR
ncbi:MAG: hypothetical protein HQM14_16410 [SAR324 cluster bacterium]|nr:hypothetical protein [SAR324 cluster bacterium]